MVGEALTGADFARMAALHVESIDDSLPALLGSRYAERFYRYLAASERELLVFERVDGRLQSACVLSEEPENLQARTAWGTLPALLGAGMRAFLTRSAFRRWLRGVLGDARRGQDASHPAPEITYIFTNRELRGRRLGARLIERADAVLRERGRDHYWVQTLDDPGNRAIAFYEKNGFGRAGVREEGGRRFVVLRKDLGRTATADQSPLRAH